MAKQLGQIHTVGYKLTNVGVGDLGLIDLPGQLSKQLQHRVRMMSTFKITGIDCAIVSGSPAAVSASLRYFAPTQGRVAALKEAWEACKMIFDAQGVRYWNNLNYDFRTPISAPSIFNLTGALGSSFLNQASIEQIAGVNEPLCLVTPPAGAKGVFAAYNESVGPLAGPAAPTFSSGFATLGPTTAGDMVLNEGVYLESRVPIAQEDMEEIPLQLSFDSVSDEASTTFMWRPDPALYLSVLTGQFIFKVDESSQAAVDIDLNFHVAGWKSIYHNDRMKRRSSKGKKHGRKRRSKK